MFRWHSLWFLVLLLLVRASDEVDSVAWVNGLPLPIPVQSPTTVTIGNTVYCIGGRLQESLGGSNNGVPRLPDNVAKDAMRLKETFSDFVFSFDTSLDWFWMDETRLPINVSGEGTSLAVGNRWLLVCGPCSHGAQVDNDYMMYDTWFKSWSTLPQNTVPRLRAATMARLVVPTGNGSFTEVMALVGGQTAPNATRRMPVECFDTVSKVWMTNCTVVYEKGISDEDECCGGSLGQWSQPTLTSFVFNCRPCTVRGPPRTDVGMKVLTITASLVGDGAIHLAVTWTVAERDGTLLPCGGITSMPPFAIAVVQSNETTNDSPVLRLFDMSSVAPSPLVSFDIPTAYFSPFRSHAGVSAAGSSLYVVGGRTAAESNGDEGEGNVTNVVSVIPSLLPIPEILTSHSTSDNIYFAGENITVYLSVPNETLVYVRLAWTGDCIAAAGIPSQLLASSVAQSEGSTADVTFSDVPPGEYYVCVAKGVCGIDDEQRAACPQYVNRSGPYTCLQRYCCWDASANDCYASRAMRGHDTGSLGLYWRSVMSLLISVLPTLPPAPGNTTTAPATTAHPTTLVPTTRSPVPTSGGTKPPALSTAEVVGIAIGSTLVLVVLLSLAAIGLAKWRMKLIDPASKKLLPIEGGDLQQSFFDRQAEAAQATTRKYRILQRIGKGAHGTVYMVQRATGASPSAGSQGGEILAMKYIPCETGKELTLALKEFNVIRALQDDCESHSKRSICSPSRGGVLSSGGSERSDAEGTAAQMDRDRENDALFETSESSGDDDDGTSRPRRNHHHAAESSREVVAAYIRRISGRKRLRPQRSNTSTNTSRRQQGPHANVIVLRDMFMDWTASVATPVPQQSPLSSLSHLPAHVPAAPSAPSNLQLKAKSPSDLLPRASSSLTSPHGGVLTPSEVNVVPVVHLPSAHVEEATRNNACPGELVVDEDDSEIERHVCIVMEYFPMGDLRRFLSDTLPRGAWLDEAIVCVIGIQLCDVLSFLHTQKPPIIHRDIKPENVLITVDPSDIMDEPGDLLHQYWAATKATTDADWEQRKWLTIRPVLTDFGLANQNDKSHMSTRAGTLHYASPESWKGNYTRAVDVWAVGCVLYAMCSRRVSPHEARIMFSDVLAVDFSLEISRELGEGGGRGYSQDLIQTILSMLRVAPHERPTALRVKRALQRTLLELLARTHS